MEISAIKERLSLSEVLQHYCLQPKNNMLKCFMHDDKTASLQVNLEKNFYKCHSCGKTGDVIQFIEDYEKLTKHEAIKKAEGMINPASALKNTSLGDTGDFGQTKISSEKSACF
ncbi:MULTISPECIES: CHC2 zinc finger domain-containing protein [Chryseobacterium]|uniref:CHC2 zinc finger domain-containing protein n=1 Tax=Chryseobacterium TaxID=59732 RepID=UPI000C9DF5BD|nr:MULTISPECIES: CHC2 zinc finger domain-containing protein [Chryseobacterium]VXC58265.1 DNA primase [Chryseobacterium sp. 8AT]